MTKITTIKLSQATKNRLEKLREFERESYDQVLQKVLHILNISRNNPEKAQKILENIDSTTKRMKMIMQKEAGKNATGNA
jgi:DNA-directed RNA polymerase subunit F